MATEAPAASRVRVTPAEWICLAAGLVLLLHYAWLLDDAYVYFRYIDNWVLLGRGLVYNEGEYAEGFTSPAWLLLLAGPRALGADYWLLVRGIGVASFVGFWWLAVQINRELSPRGAAIVDLPLAFTSFCYAVLCYFTSGTESPLVALAAACFVLFALRPGWRPGHLLLPLLPLVRPELSLALLSAMVWYLARERRPPWTMLALALLFDGGWLLFRIGYYADLFPTTFYLKNLADPAQGLRYLHDTLVAYHLYELGLLAAIALFWLMRSETRRALCLDARLFVALVGLLQIGYVVAIGGDARHFRYLAFPICALVLALGGLAEHGLPRVTAPVRRRRRAFDAALLCAAISFTFAPRQLARHPALALDQQPHFVDGIADAAHHRLHAYPLSPSPWQLTSDADPSERYQEWLETSAANARRRILVHELCYVHFMAFDQTVVHSYGLTDAVLARMPLASERPAHKEGLKPMAEDLAAILRWWARPPARGMFRASVEAGVAPEWLGQNLAGLEQIERKVYNRHQLAENLALALHRGPRLRPPSGEPSGASPR